MDMTQQKASAARSSVSDSPLFALCPHIAHVESVPSAVGYTRRVDRNTRRVG